MQEKEIDRLTAQLEAGIQNLRSSDGYKDYLQVQSRFPHYSTRNCLLILAQRPDATQVAGYTVWRSLGRQVNAGEHGIRIITPHTYKKKEPPSGSSSSPEDTDSDTLHLYFRPTSVFDVSQTSGEPLPTLLVEELQGSVDGYVQIQNAMIRISPVPVSFEAVTGGAKGYYSPSEQKIVVKRGMSEAQTIKTLSHEIGHATVHNPETNSSAYKKTSAERETEAESIAFLVCAHYGIATDDYSFPYVGSWSTGVSDKELLSQITSIKGAAVSIIDQTDAAIEQQRSEQRSEIAYQTPTGFLIVGRLNDPSVHSDGSIAYHFYDTNRRPGTSGVLALPPQISIQNAAEQILINHGLDPQDKAEISPTQIAEEIKFARQTTVRRQHW